MSLIHAVAEMPDMPKPAKPEELKLNRLQLYAVLTGDIVGSSKLNGAERRELPELLKSASRAVRSFFGGRIPLDADVFRGDSWQILVGDAWLGVRVALFFRTYLHGHSQGIRLDTRIAIGIGDIDFVPTGQVSAGDGSAFRESGRLLESMPRHRRMCVSVAGENEPTGVSAVVSLIDALVMRWTEKQSLAVLGALRGLRQAEIGSSWNPPVKQQVIARHLQQANWETIETSGLSYLENTLKKL